MKLKEQKPPQELNQYTHKKRMKDVKEIKELNTYVIKGANIFRKVREKREAKEKERRG